MFGGPQGSGFAWRAERFSLPPMSAVFRIFLLSLVLAAPFLRAADHVIVTGGPALRVWEDLRVKPDLHDRWWGTCVRAST